ncbi:unnamed protein product [Fusarium venenatum]|uniref:Uncharacterized protein n=1 Tax=Fusarium venenatum TaxID=56646 RepID=A0A2L2TTA4_9HYPO|nr:uncharacterized protein FVRRES_08794 [Fusarium venenatum]CEI68717.1 unnamed protein product [Fusarium venenatum]
MGIFNPRKKPCDLDNRSTTFRTVHDPRNFGGNARLSYNENLPVGPNTKSANAVQDHVPIVLQ